MERYWKEHEKFINEINDLRAMSKHGGNNSITDEVNMNSLPQVPSLSLAFGGDVLGFEEPHCQKGS